MIVNIQNELRDFTYITNLYKCIANYNLMGHQIGRKVGDMLEILTMGVVYQNNTLKSHLDTEGKLEGFTSAGHKVEFGFLKILAQKMVYLEQSNVNVLASRKLNSLLDI